MEEEKTYESTIGTPSMSNSKCSVLKDLIALGDNSCLF